jgi:REP-associated tyrosine transposase
MDYRYGSHTVYQIEYHFVWVIKYRYKVLQGEVVERVRELVRQTCEALEVRIVRGVVSRIIYIYLRVVLRRCRRVRL